MELVAPAARCFPTDGCLFYVRGFHKLLPLDGRKTDHRLSRVAAHAHARGIHNGQQHVFTAFVILRMPDTGETAFVALGAYG